MPYRSHLREGRNQPGRAGRRGIAETVDGPPSVAKPDHLRNGDEGGSTLRIPNRQRGSIAGTSRTVLQRRNISCALNSGRSISPLITRIPRSGISPSFCFGASAAIGRHKVYLVTQATAKLQATEKSRERRLVSADFNPYFSVCTNHLADLKHLVPGDLRAPLGSACSRREPGAFAMYGHFLITTQLVTFPQLFMRTISR